MVTQDERTNFQTWLKQNTSLSSKPIGDVASRLARVEKMVRLNTSIPPDEFLFGLGKKAEFSGLSASVKSQLKRAYRLFHQFRNSKNACGHSSAL